MLTRVLWFPYLRYSEAVSAGLHGPPRPSFTVLRRACRPACSQDLLPSPAARPCRRFVAAYRQYFFSKGQAKSVV